MRWIFSRLVMIGLMSFGLATPAMAQLDSGPDGVGLYLDLEATINRSDGAVVNPLYLLATNITFEAGIAEWGLSVRSSEPEAIIILMSSPSEVTYRPCSAGAMDLWGFYHNDPIPAGSIVFLATLMVLQPNEIVDLYIEGLQCEPGPDHPYYIGYEPSEEVRALTPSSGSMSEPVFRINGQAPVAVDVSSWGRLKTLYR